MTTLLLPGANEPNINKGPAILRACSTVTLLALFSVCARIWVRVRMVRKTGPDDYAILFAMMLSITGMGIIIPEVMNGAGRHFAYLDPATATVGLKLNFVTQPIYLWAITTVKVSIALFLLRIAPNKFYKRFLVGVITFLIVYTFVCFMTIILQCTNLALLWDSSAKGTCWTVTTLRALSYTNSSLNIITDLTFAALPVPMLWNVQINPRTKASLIGIMGLGVFACAAAIVKTSFVVNYGKTGDFLWDSANLTIWTVIECNTGIIAASLPCLKPIFRTILEKSSWAYGSNRSNNKSKNNNSHSLHNFGPRQTRGSVYNNSVTASHSMKKAQISSMIGENLSEESILPFQSNAITKTTVVTVDRSGSKGEGEAMPWSKDIAPERMIEDRV